MDLHRYKQGPLGGLLEYELLRSVFSLRLMLVIAFALLFLTIFWQAPEQLEGEIYDRDTQIILPDAKVILNDFRGVVLDSAVTDGAGRFNFSVKQRQMYTLHIFKPGYAPRVVSDSENMNAARAVVLRIGVHRTPVDR